MSSYYVDELPSAAYHRFTAEEGACDKCQGLVGGWRWTSVSVPVHYNCGCHVTEDEVAVEHGDPRTDTLSEHKEREWVTTVDRGGSSSVSQTWSMSGTWTTTGKVSVGGEIGPVKIGGEIGSSYGNTTGTTTGRTSNFTYQSDVGGAHGQQVYAVYSVRERQDVDVYLFLWGAATKDSGDEEVQLRKGPPYTERKFEGYEHVAID